MLMTSEESFLSLMNSYKYPDFTATVHLVEGPLGERFITARPVEAWDRWAEVNGYDSTDKFMEYFGDSIVWSENYRRGTLRDGGSIQSMDVQGFYRDGDKHL